MPDFVLQYSCIFVWILCCQLWQSVFFKFLAATVAVPNLRPECKYLGPLMPLIWIMGFKARFVSSDLRVRHLPTRLGRLPGTFFHVHQSGVELPSGRGELISPTRYQLSH